MTQKQAFALHMYVHVLAMALHIYLVDISVHISIDEIEILAHRHRWLTARESFRPFLALGREG